MTLFLYYIHNIGLLAKYFSYVSESVSVQATEVVTSCYKSYLGFYLFIFKSWFSPNNLES